MLAAGLITFREGLEAALIIGILISYLVKIGQSNQLRLAWAGVGVAITVSIAAAIVLQIIGASLQEPYEQIFEGTMMLLAVIILTWMIFWMRYQGRFMKRNLEARVQTTLARQSIFGIFGLAFVAVLREGIETALFLSASAFATNETATLIGSIIGLSFAVFAGYAIYAMSVRLDVKKFFDVTSVLLLLFAAGLFAQAIHEYQEIGWLAFLTQQAWNLENILPISSTGGSILRTLFGYNDAPSILEVIAYVSYWLAALLGVRWGIQHLTTRIAPTQAQA